MPAEYTLYTLLTHAEPVRAGDSVAVPERPDAREWDALLHRCREAGVCLRWEGYDEAGEDNGPANRYDVVARPADHWQGMSPVL